MIYFCSAGKSKKEEYSAVHSKEEQSARTFKLVDFGCVIRAADGTPQDQTSPQPNLELASKAFG
jgi:hypothetical protein